LVNGLPIRNAAAGGLAVDGLISMPPIGIVKAPPAPFGELGNQPPAVANAITVSAAARELSRMGNFLPVSCGRKQSANTKFAASEENPVQAG